MRSHTMLGQEMITTKSPTTNTISYSHPPRSIYEVRIFSSDTSLHAM